MRYKLLFVIFGFILLCGCSGKTAKDNVAEPENNTDTVAQSDAETITVVRTEKKEKLYIPDPKGYSNNEKIVLPEKTLLGKESLYVDLPFSGIKGEMRLAAWGSGEVLTPQSGTENIKYEFGGSQEKLPGNCIVLSVVNRNDKNYLILLDYINGKSYVTNTGLQLTATKRPEIKFADLTTDGLEEIILTNVPDGYKSGTLCEIYRLDYDSNELKNIYKTKGDYLNGTLEQEFFESELRDNYEVLVTCPQINYSETIHLLDIGFGKKELEVAYRPKDDMDGCNFYKNGHVIEKGRLHISNKKESGGVVLLDDEISDYKKIHFRYVIYLERWHNVGELDAQMYYNEINDSMEIETAVFREKSEE